LASSTFSVWPEKSGAVDAGALEAADAGGALGPPVDALAAGALAPADGDAAPDGVHAARKAAAPAPAP
jgi:hypothetical protein